MGKPATIDAGQEQHLQALEYANRVRLARARMKRRVAAGELSASEVILSCPWQAHSMSISDLLMSQKRWGRAWCRRLFVSLGVPENKQIGTLTERQRLALAAVLAAKNAPAGTSSVVHPADAKRVPAAPPRGCEACPRGSRAGHASASRKRADGRLTGARAQGGRGEAGRPTPPYPAAISTMWPSGSRR